MLNTTRLLPQMLACRYCALTSCGEVQLAAAASSYQLSSRPCASAHPGDSQNFRKELLAMMRMAESQLPKRENPRNRRSKSAPARRSRIDLTAESAASPMTGSSLSKGAKACTLAPTRAGLASLRTPICPPRIADRNDDAPHRETPYPCSKADSSCQAAPMSIDWAGGNCPHRWRKTRLVQGLQAWPWRQAQPPLNLAPLKEKGGGQTGWLSLSCHHP